MKDFIKVHKRQFIFGSIFIILFAIFKVNKHRNKSEDKVKEEVSVETEIKERKASVISFGEWSPDAFREILGTVQSDNEVDVKAEVSGKIKNVYANVGDSVRSGQALAQYDLAGDPTAINYQGALNSLQSARLSAANSIKASETALDNAKRDLEKTRIQQAQNNNQSYVGLGTTAKNAETIFDGALDFLDRMLGATLEYRSQVVFGRNQVGATNTILKNKTRTEVEGLIRELSTLKLQTAPSDKFGLEIFTRKRLAFSEKIKSALANYDQLIINTVISETFSETDRQSIQQQLDAFKPQIDAQISALNSSLEGTKTTNVGTDVAILAAENRVKSAEDQLELAKSQAEAQIVAAQNQVNLAAASQSDLTIRASISGKLASRTVKNGDLVSPGTVLFTIVNEQGSKKVVAYLTQDEWLKAQLVDEIKIEVGGSEFFTKDKFLSPKLDAQTQKVLAEFMLPSEASLVGNLAKVFIPLGVANNGQKLLIPFSAISFEPDGAEVLVLNGENIAQRKKVVVGKVVVSNVEIVSGLEVGDKIVEFYKRILPGEKVITDEVVASEEETVTEIASNNVE